VLLVHHNHREVAELHRVLDQGMCADHELKLPARQPVEQLAASRGASGASEELHRQWPSKQRVDGAVVLLGKRLRGCHQGGLSAVFDGAQHRCQGDHRLAGSDLPHQQALHRLLARQVGVDLLDRSLLVARELERQ
jgi:hypothetical protein